MEVDLEALKLLVASLVTAEVSDHKMNCPAVDAVEELRIGQDETHKLLESLNRWKLSLWSNGSGGPKGWLEINEVETNRKFEAIFGSLRELKASKYMADGASAQAEKDATKTAKADEVHRGWWQLALNVLAVAGGAYFFDFIKNLVLAALQLHK